MKAEKLSYWKINTLMILIDGKVEEEKVIILGLANEPISMGVSVKLARIKKVFAAELATFKELFEKIGEGTEFYEEKITLWNTEIEVSFEPIALNKVEDLVPTKNAFGFTPSYVELLEIIAE